MSNSPARKMDFLPSLPPVLERLLATLDDPQSSASDVEEILHHDQSTTSRLLGVANSAYYGMRHDITSVARAVVILGLGEVRSICISTVMEALLSPASLSERRTATQVWLHSFAVQEAVRVIARRLDMPRLDVALTAGLLHDVGWVVMMSYFEPQWQKLRRALDQGATPEQAQAQAGMNHQEAGGLLARHWDLPAPLEEVITRHHQPGPDLSHFSLVALVHLADALAWSLGMGALVKQPAPAYLEEAVSGMGISSAVLAECRREMEKDLEEKKEHWLRLLAS